MARARSRMSFPNAASRRLRVLFTMTLQEFAYPLHVRRRYFGTDDGKTNLWGARFREDDEVRARKFRVRPLTNQFETVLLQQWVNGRELNPRHSGFSF